MLERTPVMNAAHFTTLACALIVPSVSYGLGIRIADQDARATARGNAFAATADNPPAIYYNPAGITQLYDRLDVASKVSLGKGTVAKSTVTEETGLRVRTGIYGITLENRVDPLAKGQDNFDIKRKVQFAPSFFATYK